MARPTMKKVFKNLKIWFLTFCLTLAIAPAFVSLAAEPQQATASGVDSKCTNGIALQVPIGNIDCVPDLGQYLKWIYQISISIVGLISIVMIMIGGIKWITAAGSGRIKEAQEEIFAAVMGMFILIGAYTILNFINPQLINVGVKLPDVKLTGGFGACIDSDGKCTNTTEVECKKKNGRYSADKSCDAETLCRESTTPETTTLYYCCIYTDSNSVKRCEAMSTPLTSICRNNAIEACHMKTKDISDNSSWGVEDFQYDTNVTGVQCEPGFLTAFNCTPIR